MANMLVGETQIKRVSVDTITNGTLDSIDFTLVENILTPGVASITPTLLAGNTASTELTALREGTASLVATAQVTGPGGTNTCTQTMAISTTNASAWWQAQGGSVISGGTVRSQIPVTCIAPSCTNRLILDDNISAFPGNLVRGAGSLTLGLGSVSSTGWNTQASVGITPFTYEFFQSQASGKPFTEVGNPTGMIPPGHLRNGSPDENGFVWLRTASRNYRIEPTDITIDRKVILFVDGNLTISRKITIDNPEDNFFMVIVNGDITIDPGVFSTGTNDPALEGIYFASGTFSTGNTNRMLVVRGSVVANSISLQRNLGIGNITIPAETFISMPELLLNYPSSLTRRRLLWREVAP